MEPLSHSWEARRLKSGEWQRADRLHIVLFGCWAGSRALTPVTVSIFCPIFTFGTTTAVLHSWFVSWRSPSDCEN